MYNWLRLLTVAGEYVEIFATRHLLRFLHAQLVGLIVKLFHLRYDSVRGQRAKFYKKIWCFNPDQIIRRSRINITSDKRIMKKYIIFRFFLGCDL